MVQPFEKHERHPPHFKMVAADCRVLYLIFKACSGPSNRLAESMFFFRTVTIARLPTNIFERDRLSYEGADVLYNVTVMFSLITWNKGNDFYCSAETAFNDLTTCINAFRARGPGTMVFKRAQVAELHSVFSQVHRPKSVREVKTLSLTADTVKTIGEGGGGVIKPYYHKYLSLVRDAAQTAEETERSSSSEPQIIDRNIPLEPQEIAKPLEVKVKTTRSEQHLPLAAADATAIAAPVVEVVHHPLKLDKRVTVFRDFDGRGSRQQSLTNMPPMMKGLKKQKPQAKPLSKSRGRLRSIKVEGVKLAGFRRVP